MHYRFELHCSFSIMHAVQVREFPAYNIIIGGKLMGLLSVNWVESLILL